MGTGLRTTLIIVGAQLVATALCAGVSAVLGGGHAAWSAGVGGVISILATIYFALRALGPGGGRPVRTLVRRFYAAEAQKLLLTAVLFYVAIRWLEVAFLPMISAFAVTLLVYWLVLPVTLNEIPVTRE